MTFDPDPPEEPIQKPRKTAKPKQSESKKRGSAFPRELRRFEEMFKTFIERNPFGSAQEIDRLTKQMAVLLQSARIRDSEREKDRDRLLMRLHIDFNGAITRQLRARFCGEDAGDAAKDAERSARRIFYRNWGFKI
jgi:hypothetical protein